MTTRIGLFAYGSLVDPDSAARTLGRELPPPVAGRLDGWRRRWSQFRDNLAVEKTFARRDGGEMPRHLLGLNMERSGSGDEAPNGALLEVCEEELLRLDVRELRYDRIEVPAVGGFDRVFTYTAKPVNFAPQPPPDSGIVRAYVEFVEAAFAGLGDAELGLFRETTAPPPVELVDAVLVRDRIPPGNPREW
jgi:hypothetical protein